MLGAGRARAQSSEPRVGYSPGAGSAATPAARSTGAPSSPRESATGSATGLSTAPPKRRSRPAYDSIAAHRCRRAEVGPQRVEEHHLGVGALPEQEVARALLAARPHEEIHVGGVGLVEVGADRALGDAVRGDAAGRGLLGDAAHGIHQLDATAVVDAHREGEAGVAGGAALGLLELGDDAAPQPRAAPRPADAHVPRVELVAAAAQHLAVEAHEEPHLLGAAAPVLGREGVDAEVRDAELDGAGDDVEQARLARAVPLDAGEALEVGPAAVAVHDDRDVLRHGGGRDGGGMLARPVDRTQRLGDLGPAGRAALAAARARRRPALVALRAAHAVLPIARSSAGCTGMLARASRSTCGSERRPRSRWNCA